MLAPLAAGAWRRASIGWFCVRLSGVYLAMLTLAFAQIVWSIAFQWDARHRRLQRPGRRLAGAVARRQDGLLLPGARSAAALGIALLWRALFSPFGYALRAGRDSPLRAEAIGIDVRATQWVAFALAGAFAGLAGGRLRLLQGQHLARDDLASPRSVDALVMVLLGGVRRADRPAGRRRASSPGCATRCARHTEYWRAVLGRGDPARSCCVFPQGLVGGAQGARRALARGATR